MLNIILEQSMHLSSGDAKYVHAILRTARFWSPEMSCALPDEYMASIRSLQVFRAMRKDERKKRMESMRAEKPYDSEIHAAFANAEHEPEVIVLEDILDRRIVTEEDAPKIYALLRTHGPEKVIAERNRAFEEVLHDNIPGMIHKMTESAKFQARMDVCRENMMLKSIAVKRPRVEEDVDWVISFGANHKLFHDKLARSMRGQEDVVCPAPVTDYPHYGAVWYALLDLFQKDPGARASRQAIFVSLLEGAYAPFVDGLPVNRQVPQMFAFSHALREKNQDELDEIMRKVKESRGKYVSGDHKKNRGVIMDVLDTAGLVLSGNRSREIYANEYLRSPITLDSVRENTL